MKEEKERLDRKRRRQDKPPVELLFDEDDIDEASNFLYHCRGIKLNASKNSNSLSDPQGTY